MPNCKIGGCGYTGKTLRSMKRHYNEIHSGEIETPEEYLPDDNSEQRDFNGEEPSTDGHDPEHVVTNEPDDGEFTDLSSFGRDDDE